MPLSDCKVAPVDDTNKIRTNIYDHVNYFLAFRENTKLAAFRKHQKEETTFEICLVSHVLISLLFILTRTAYILYHFSPFAVLNFIVAISVILLGTLNSVLSRINAYKGKNFQQFIRNTWILGIHVTLCLGVLFCSLIDDDETHTVNCVKNSTRPLEEYGCGFSKSNGIPTGIMMSILVTPSVMTMVFGNIRWDLQCFAWCLNSFTILVCILHFGFIENLKTFAIVVPFSFYLMYAVQVQCIRLFLASEGRIVHLMDKEKLVELEHLLEMRSLIGNMAHDLKTVSTV